MDGLDHPVGKSPDLDCGMVRTPAEFKRSGISRMERDDAGNGQAQDGGMP